MRFTFLFVAILGLAIPGCGGGMAKAKGRILENGQPKMCPPFSSSITFTPVATGGDETAKGPTFTSPINADGTFEVLVSGGQLPPGDYDISVRFGAAKGGPVSFRRELVSGLNDLTLDLAKPGG